MISYGLANMYGLFEMIGLSSGYSIKIFDKNVLLSKLSGTNKDYIDNHIPHLSELLFEDIHEVVSDSEILIITHNIVGVKELIEKNSDKKFIDLVGINSRIEQDNYEGICW